MAAMKKKKASAPKSGQSLSGKNTAHDLDGDYGKDMKKGKKSMKSMKSMKKGKK